MSENRYIKSEEELGIAAENRDKSEFNDLARRRQFYSSLFQKKASDGVSHTDGMTSEEVRQTLSAFEANPRSAAGFRMHAYLQWLKSGSILAAYPQREKAESREGRRIWGTFQFFTLMAIQQRQAFVAQTYNMLRDAIADLMDRRDHIRTIIDKIATEYESLKETITGAASEIAFISDYAEENKTAIARMKERLANANILMQQEQQQIENAAVKTASLENRAIKIVRPLNSISELKASLTGEETEPPVIYIVAGEAQTDGTLFYERITMGENGQIKIERVHESEAPALLKNHENMASDLVERVYHRRDENGESEFVRMEYGFNGELMGSIGHISNQMIRQYIATTGNEADDITSCADAYEEKVRGWYRNIDEHNHICREKSIQEDEYRHALEHLEQTIDALELKQDKLLQLQNRANLCCGRLQTLTKELTLTNQMIMQATEYQSRLQNDEFTSVDDMLVTMPKGLKRQFLFTANAHHNRHGSLDTASAETKPHSFISRAWVTVIKPSAAAAQDDFGNENERTAWEEKFEPV